MTAKNKRSAVRLSAAESAGAPTGGQESEIAKIDAKIKKIEQL